MLTRRLPLQTIAIFTVMFSVCCDRSVASLISVDSAHWDSLSSMTIGSSSSVRVPQSYDEENKHQEHGNQGTWRCHKGMASDVSHSGPNSSTSVNAIASDSQVNAEGDFSVWRKQSAEGVKERELTERLFRPPESH